MESLYHRACGFVVGGCAKHRVIETAATEDLHAGAAVLPAAVWFGTVPPVQGKGASKKAVMDTVAARMSHPSAGHGLPKVSSSKIVSCGFMVSPCHAGLQSDRFTGTYAARQPKRTSPYSNIGQGLRGRAGHALGSGGPCQTVMATTQGIRRLADF
jgi:hypothetical protein